MPVVSLALCLGAALAWGDPYADCSRKVAVEISIPACSRIIEKSDAKADGQLSDVYITRGNAYFSKGDYDRAIADFDMAIKLKPNDVEAYIKRGIVYNSTGEHKRAIADFGMAIELRPNRASIYTMRADAYQKTGDKQRTIADLRKALEIDPSLQVVKGELERLGAVP